MPLVYLSMRACFAPWYPKETSVAPITSSLKHLKIAFLRLPFSHRTRQYHETLFFGNSSLIDITTLTTKPIEKRTGSLHMVTVLRQPVAKMLRHFTRKTLFLPKVAYRPAWRNHCSQGTLSLLETSSLVERPICAGILDSVGSGRFGKIVVCTW